MTRWIHLRVAVSLLAAVAWAAVPLGTAARGAESASFEYQVKAACLYNFAKFVDWPPRVFAEVNDPIIYGILGEDPFGNTLEAVIKNKTINGRPLTIKRSGQVEDLKGCQVLFISRSARARQAQILKSLEGLSILTVSDTEEFLAEGGMIRFLIEEKKVRFEINLSAARRASLKIDPLLLSLATSVRTADAGKGD